MNNRLIIIGAGGHGKAIADNALKNGYTDICFIDDDAVGTCLDLPIIGTSSDITELNDGKTDFIIGIGNNAIRKEIAEKYSVNWVSLIHPSAQIATHVSIGKGTVVMAGAVINVCATVGSHCIINTHAVVEHDNVVEDYVHISPNAALGGTVRIGKETHIGIGATVINNIEICANCIVGAASLVLRNINKNGTFYGIISHKNSK